jgi:predicted amino acid racemase
MDVTRRRNPDLINAAVQLHRSGRIPSNSYVIDLDTVVTNSARVAATGAETGIQLFQMTKQFGRNPVVAEAVAAAGIPQAVAVDFDEARVLHHAGVALGHLGHLVQVPWASAQEAVRMNPGQVTVQNLSQARHISQAAQQAGRVQRLVLRVVGEKDVFYPAQRGGVAEADLIDTAERVTELPGLELVGVTSFPCLLMDEASASLQPTANLHTILRCATTLREAGFAAPVVNAPSATCIASLPTLVRHGATQAEPGSCLTGHTPLHAVSDQPELPAMVYVTETTHTEPGSANTLGGGFYARSRARSALVFGSADDPVPGSVQADPADTIDYHGTLTVDGDVSVGATVVYAFRSQVFVSRATVAVVENCATQPRVLGLFSRDGFRIDDAGSTGVVL